MRIHLVLAGCIMLLFPMTGTAQQVTYSLGTATALLDSDYYSGADRNGSGASPSGRFAMFAQSSKSGAQVAFWQVASNLSSIAIFSVEIGRPSSWRRISQDFASAPSKPMAWTPDDQYIIVGNFRFNTSLGAMDSPFGYEINDPTAGGTVFVGTNDSSTTNKSSGNWLLTLANHAGLTTVQILAVPILPDGLLDPSRQPVYVTNFASTLYPDWPTVAPDGSMAAFADFRGGGSYPNVGDIADVYVMQDLTTILNAPLIPGTIISSAAPTDALSPRIVPIRTNEDGVDNFAHVPQFSQDKGTLFWTEDWNNKFTDSNFFGSMALGDFDIMLSASNGASLDTRFVKPGNQFISGVTPGGVRVIALDGAGTSIQLMITSLETTTHLVNETQTLDSGATEVTIGGEVVTLPPQIVLTDSAVQTTTAVEVADASGTVIALPQDQVINFPTGTVNKAITITTPIDPIAEAQLPSGFVDAIPIVRQFGPEGTQFFPPIEITISYTDAEIAGLEETNLKPYLFNPLTGVFDIAVPPADIVLHDLDNNTITFRVSHFSIYGIGSNTIGSLPAVQPWGLVVLAVGIGCAVLLALRRQARAARR